MVVIQAGNYKWLKGLLKVLGMVDKVYKVNIVDDVDKVEVLAMAWWTRWTW